MLYKTCNRIELSDIAQSEAIMINKSFLALGQVTNALSSNPNGFIPYRDSKLTRLLQQGLGGNSKTMLVIHITPSNESLSESFNTLKFGLRAMKIFTKYCINEKSQKDYQAYIGATTNATPTPTPPITPTPTTLNLNKRRSIDLTIDVANALLLSSSHSNLTTPTVAGGMGNNHSNSTMNMNNALLEMEFEKERQDWKGLIDEKEDLIFILNTDFEKLQDIVVEQRRTIYKLEQQCKNIVEIKQKLQTLEADWQAKIDIIEGQKKEIENENNQLKTELEESEKATKICQENREQEKQAYEQTLAELQALLMTEQMRNKHCQVLSEMTKEDHAKALLAMKQELEIWIVKYQTLLANPPTFSSLDFAMLNTLGSPEIKLSLPAPLPIDHHHDHFITSLPEKHIIHLNKYTNEEYEALAHSQRLLTLQHEELSLDHQRLEDTKLSLEAKISELEIEKVKALGEKDSLQVLLLEKDEKLEEMQGLLESKESMLTQQHKDMDEHLQQREQFVRYEDEEILRHAKLQWQDELNEERMMWEKKYTEIQKEHVRETERIIHDLTKLQSCVNKEDKEIELIATRRTITMTTITCVKTLNEDEDNVCAAVSIPQQEEIMETKTFSSEKQSESQNDQHKKKVEVNSSALSVSS